MKKYDVVAVTGTYTDKEGNEKARWLNCGVVIEKEGKLSLKLECVPVASDGWFKLFEPKEKSANRGADSRSGAAQDPDDLDRLPF